MDEVSHENAILVLLALLPLVFAALLILLVRRNHRPAEDPSSPLVVLGANALGAALCVALLALGGEIYFRFFYDTTDAFGVTKTTRKWLANHYAINAAGMRDDLPVYPASTSPGRARITFLGDSFTAGYGIPDVNERFANLVRAQRPDWEIHVLADNGWNSGAQIEVMASHPEYEADRVVLVYGLNDISDIDPRWQELRDFLHEEGKPSHYLSQHSYLFNWLHYRWLTWNNETLSRYFDYQLDAYQGPLWKSQRQRLSELNDIVKERGGSLYVVTFPFVHALGTDYRYRRIHEQLNRFWQRKNVPHLDLLTTFEGMQADDLVVNAYDSHPNELAHRMASDSILPFLEEQIGGYASGNTEAP
ncbi:SGNH/GDSL hydrolase family protein [Myxococcota bacterium]|nr:SGNH/GDSL hydrolase family protein [Myxococcota bacterium]